MKLVVTTPLAIVVEADDVAHVRAEDASGAFGILPGHAEFLTALRVSVVTWRDAAGAEHHVAVRGGVLSVRDGARVEIATREAIGEDRLEALGPTMLARFRAEEESEQRSRLAAMRLHVAAIRRLQRYLEGGRRPPPPAAGEPQ